MAVAPPAPIPERAGMIDADAVPGMAQVRATSRRHL
jgi:hypothetical protein